MTRHALTFALAALTALDCGGFDEVTAEDLAHTPNLPDSETPPDVPRYQGSNAITAEAQLRMPTVLDLHQKVIRRSCSGTGGVCHNQKEYPDMQSAEAFIELIDAPCNASPSDPLGVFDRCERRGDTMTFTNRDSNQVEVGSITVIPGEPVDFQAEGSVPGLTAAGLHVMLADPLEIDSSDGSFWGHAEWSRVVDDSAQVQDLRIASLETRWWRLGDGRHLFAEIPNYLQSRLEDVMDASIAQGDQNRNGNFGAQERPSLSLIASGAPQESYLLGRLRGTLGGSAVPGTRMPLANLPPTVVDMVALTCFVEGLSEGQRPGPSWGINYRDCSVAENPESVAVTGSGAATWEGGVLPLLTANCGGCHSGAAPAGDLDLVSESTFDRLRGASRGNPQLNLVVPGNPSSSYLWLKLIADPGIVGSAMPLDDQGNSRPLAAGDLETIRSWIEAGALQN